MRPGLVWPRAGHLVDRHRDGCQHGIAVHGELGMSVHDVVPSLLGEPDDPPVGRSDLHVGHPPEGNEGVCHQLQVSGPVGGGARSPRTRHGGQGGATPSVVSKAASRAAASIVRAPSRQISSSIDRPSAPDVSSFTTLSTGVPSSPALHRRQLVLISTRKVRRVSRRVSDPQLQVIPQAGGHSTTSGHSSRVPRQGPAPGRHREAARPGHDCRAPSGEQISTTVGAGDGRCMLGWLSCPVPDDAEATRAAAFAASASATRRPRRIR